MLLIILIAFLSLVALIVLHELGHFVLAKKFGVKVEEFGIGYPPRIFGKKIGETVYSLNLLPFGAFVKIKGEIGGIEDSRSFSNKPIWQRAFIILGGVISFWLISAVLLSFLMALGVPTAIGDEENHNLKEPKVQIISIAPDSPAGKEGLKAGDTIKKLQITNYELQVTKVKEVQEFTAEHLGEKITLTVERGKDTLDVKLVPRESPPEGEGAMGIGLVRTALKKYPWYQAPIRGVLACGNLTVAVIQGWGYALASVIRGVPSGVQLMGPVGIFSLFAQVGQLGVNYFVQFIAIISIYLALFNILPIPALDGGKLLFLGIEKVRKRPISQKIEQQITAVFFALLIVLIIWVTIKDIAKLF